MFDLLDVQLASVERGNWYDEKKRTAFIARIDDVNALLRSRDLTCRRSSVPLDAFPDANGTDREILASFLSNWPVFSDGAHHDAVRQALGHCFRELTGNGLAQTVAHEASTLVEALAAGAVHDWIDSVVRPLSTGIVRLLLPTDSDVLDRTITLSQVIMDGLALTQLDDDAAAAALTAAKGLATLVRNDLMHGDGPLNRTLRRLYELPGCGLAGATGALAQVVTGALDPLMAAIGALPVVMSAEREPLPGAVWREEVLRLSSPFRFAARIATNAVRVGDMTIEPGDRVVLLLGAANLDPAAYVQPHHPAPREQLASHVAFGAGPHYCAGASVVRAALDGVLAGLTTRRSWFDVRRVRYRPGTFLRFDCVEGVLSHGDRVR